MTPRPPRPAPVMHRRRRPVTGSAPRIAPAADAGWADESTALGWARSDAVRGLLDLPWRLAVEVAAADLREITQVVDVGSGPGDFLAVALARCPRARGIWIDVSPAMERLARTRLGAQADRVRFTVTDLAEMHRAVPARSADLIVSSRVTHHLDAAALAGFYRWAASALRPGGWLANWTMCGSTSRGPADCGRPGPGSSRPDPRRTATTTR